MAVVGAVGAVAAVYAIGYADGPGLRRAACWATLPLFVVAMLLVPAAGTRARSCCVGADGADVAAAGAGRARGVARRSGRPRVVRGDDPAGVRAAPDRVAGAGRSRRRGSASTSMGCGSIRGRPGAVVFVLCLVGFGSKAGIVPLHAWLPRAHPEAPSHVSALMSAAMVNMGVYGACWVGLRPAAARAALVVAAGARARCGLGGLRDPAGRGQHRPQAAAGLLHHREHGPGAGRRSGDRAAAQVGRAPRCRPRWR